MHSTPPHRPSRLPLVARPCCQVHARAFLALLRLHPGANGTAAHLFDRGQVHGLGNHQLLARYGNGGRLLLHKGEGRTGDGSTVSSRPAARPVQKQRAGWTASSAAVRPANACRAARKDSQQCTDGVPWPPDPDPVPLLTRSATKRPSAKGAPPWPVGRPANRPVTLEFPNLGFSFSDVPVAMLLRQQASGRSGKKDPRVLSPGKQTLKGRATKEMRETTRSRPV
jgi:hypothetical protein